MKNIHILLTLITVALLFAACSGDGKGEFNTGNTKIIVTDCETYTLVQTNDLLVKDNDNTTIKIIHDANGTKQVCSLTGSAHIIREN